MASLDTTLSKYHSNCFIPVLSTSEDLTMVAKMDQVPNMVVYMGKLDHTNLIHSIGPYHGLLFEYSPGSSVITVTCQGLARQGVLYDLSHSLGHVDDMCSMRNREIRIAYNKSPPLFDVNNLKVDSATLEGAVLDTFLEKYSLRPSFVHGKQRWGGKNETSGLWDGVIGLVRESFQDLIFPNFLKVGNNSCDLGVTAIIYLPDRTSIIQYTDPVLGRFPI